MNHKAVGLALGIGCLVIILFLLIFSNVSRNDFFE